MTNSSCIKTYQLVQDGEKSFEVPVVSKSVALTVLVNFHNFQGHEGTNKMYSVIKRDYFWKGMWKTYTNLFQNCHICIQENLEKESYSYIHMKQFDLTACDLTDFFYTRKL